MVEFILIKPEDLKIQAMMIIVTGTTGFTVNFCRCMIPFVLINTRFQLSMAIQAFVVRYLITKSMALGTVR